MDFDDLKDYADISYDVTCDGIKIDSEMLNPFSVAPHGEATTELDDKLLYTHRKNWRMQNTTIS